MKTSYSNVDNINIPTSSPVKGGIAMAIGGFIFVIFLPSCAGVGLREDVPSPWPAICAHSQEYVRAAERSDDGAKRTAAQLLQSDTAGADEPAVRNLLAQVAAAANRGDVDRVRQNVEANCKSQQNPPPEPGATPESRVQTRIHEY